MRLGRRPTGYGHRWFAPAVAVLYFAVNSLPLIWNRILIVEDDYIQNNPLRFLTGEIFRSGHLPFWNLFSWSGTPLMAGMNAGSFYPLSALYVILPSNWAFLVQLSLFEAAFAAGMYWLFDQLGLRRLPALLIAVPAPLLGYFAAEIVHTDMLGGLAMVPYMVVAIVKLTRAENGRQALSAGLLLGVSYALVVLAGAPEAMIYEATFIALFAILEMVRARVPLRRLPPFALAFALTAGLLPAIQLLPGLAFVGISQRGHVGASFAIFGPATPTSFLLLTSPYLFGGPIPRSGQAGYFGPFNYEEIQIFVGIIPLALAIYALVTLVARRRGRAASPLPYSTARTLQDLGWATLFSTVAAFGASTPLESLLLHLPLYNKQRLPARNIFAFDFYLEVLAGFGLQRLFTYRPSRKHLTVIATILAGAAVVETAALFLDGRLTQAVGYKLDWSNGLGFIVASSATEILILAGFVAVLRNRRRIPRKAFVITLAALIALDTAAYNYQGFFATNITPALAAGKASGDQYLADQVRAVGGRLAVYDPLNRYWEQNIQIGGSNTWIYDHLASTTGYSSISLASYEAATQSHARTNMTATAFYTSLGPDLELNTAVMGPGYFFNTIPAGMSAVNIPYPITLPTTVSTQGATIRRVADFVGRPVTASRILLDFAVPQSSGSQPVNGFGIGSIVRIGVRLSPSGSIIWAEPGPRVPQALSSTASYSFVLPTASTFDQVVAEQRIPADVYDPAQAIVAGVAIDQGASYWALDANLSASLTPMQWNYSGSYAGLDFFHRLNVAPLVHEYRNAAVPPPLPLPGSRGFRLISASATVSARLDYLVKASAPTTMTISEAYAPGWKVTETGSFGTRSFAASKCGIFICMPLPAGGAHVVLTYEAPRFKTGAALSLLGLLWLAGALMYLRRSRRHTT